MILLGLFYEKKKKKEKKAIGILFASNIEKLPLDAKFR